MRLNQLLLLVLALGCYLSSCEQKPAWKGKLVHGYVDNINEYDFAAKKDRTVFDKGDHPFVTNPGETYFVSQAFPKANSLVRKRTAGGQFKDVLDLSNANPDYSEALANYSLIRGTGISGVISSLSDPKVSPDGKFLSVTIFGYPGLAFEKNCVAVFDLSTKKLVTKFDDKYYGNWLPDGRLLMSGWHKKESSDGSLYKSAPGIFLADASLSNISRIDKELDDPAPYHATASPDGKKIAFILNNHLWVMNLDGTAAKQVTDVDNDNVESFPAWSPDGKYLACWVYKTFERSFFTAIAVVSATTTKPVVLSDKAPVWPRDQKGYRISGGSNQFSWK